MVNLSFADGVFLPVFSFNPQSFISVFSYTIKCACSTLKLTEYIFANVQLTVVSIVSNRWRAKQISRTGEPPWNAKYIYVLCKQF